MSEQLFEIKIHYGRIECNAWIDHFPAPGGGWKLVGMGSRTEFDEYGKMISHKIEPTGVTGWAPQEMFGDKKLHWWS